MGIGTDSQQMQRMQLDSVLRMKNQEIDRLKVEVRCLVHIQVEQAALLMRTLNERMALEQKLAEAMKTESEHRNLHQSVASNDTGAMIATFALDPSKAMNNSVFLRLFW
jgi:predicted type IV restriction endonuclease